MTEIKLNGTITNNREKKKTCTKYYAFGLNLSRWIYIITALTRRKCKNGDD